MLNLKNYFCRISKVQDCKKTTNYEIQKHP